MMYTMINAREANARANDSARALVETFIEERVAPRIWDAVEKGRFLVRFFVKNDDNVDVNMLVNRLEEFGYTVYDIRYVAGSQCIGIRWYDEDIEEEEELPIIELDPDDFVADDDYAIFVEKYDAAFDVDEEDIII